MGNQRPDFETMSERIRRAFQIAKAAHDGQKDKGGVDYILHPMKVASDVGDGESAIIALLLHDVVEDTDVTFEDLGDLLNAEEMVALKLLTHDDKIPYMDYIRSVSANRMVMKVKMADLRNNMDLSRLPSVTERGERRVEKYRRAYDFLNSMCDESVDSM